ncbi:dUTP diphosphatase [Paraferrimonas sp. SM1919]|uniref:dUTP diphosphatase n=1 Tax=Paraferrimonas sp. SM1919 TaxID=2662263 RepID=UPI0013D3D103|nr:dUTP diphosphatase [Paraferrimonas sp. SM1919]
MNQAQLTTMLNLQQKMNSRVNPDWFNAGYAFHRAIVIEAAEGIEHHGWKWWKKQQCDLPQLQLELVDIWHFMLSAALISNENQPQLAAKELENSLNESCISFDGKDVIYKDYGLIEKLELMIGLATNRRIHSGLFAALLIDCQMDWNELFRQYVAKNVLNIFRQDHGYKEGTYIKVWAGKEDNEHLVEAMDSLDANQDSFADDVYATIASKYPN